MTVNLDFEAWQRVLALLSQGPWRDANPLIMAIGDQLRAQTPQPGQEPIHVQRPREENHRPNSGDNRSA